MEFQFPGLLGSNSSHSQNERPKHFLENAHSLEAFEFQQERVSEKELFTVQFRLLDTSRICESLETITCVSCKGDWESRNRADCWFNVAQAGLELLVRLRDDLELLVLFLCTVTPD